MSTKIRPRTLAVLTVVIGLLGIVAVTVQPSGAVEPSVVRLNLGSDGRYFEYGPAVQVLSTPPNGGGCQISSAEPIINLSSTPNQSNPGLGPDGIGVKQSNASGNGTPCTQVETMETLRLEPGSTIPGKLFKGVRLDLEMTGNAVVRLTFAGGATPSPVTYTLQTGTSIAPAQAAEWTPADRLPPYLVSSGPGDEVDACAAPNSSGPNNGSNDNCQWTVFPATSFRSVTLATTIGTVSLEGGGDFPANEDWDTLLYLSNSAPTAVNDTYSTNEDTTLNGDVTDNDTDPEGGALTGATATSGPSHGTLSLASNGTFSYLPAANFNGSDSFTYTASDGTSTSNTATVNITVLAVNDAPQPTGNDVDIEEDDSGTVVVATDVDIDDELTVECTDVPDGWLVEDLGGGEVQITPPPDFVGSITITCTVTDADGATTDSPVTIDVGVTNVNDAPTALDDEAEIDAESASVDILVLDNDSDPDGDDLSVANIDLLDGGSATVSGGTVTYTPPVGITSPVSFTYQASDGQALSNVATVTVHPLICSTQSVSTPPGDVSGSFTRLSDPEECKRYALEVQLDPEGDGTILFQPSGDDTPVEYRGVVTFGPDVDPQLGADSLQLRYDPTGGFGPYQLMQWCVDPQFDVDQILESDGGVPLFATVTSATLPGNQSWCIASAHTQGDDNADKVTHWQLYGVEDPRILK